MEFQFNFGPGMAPGMDDGVAEEPNETWESLPKDTPILMDIPGIGRRIVEIPEYEVVD